MLLNEAYLKSFEYLQKYLKGKQGSEMRHNKLFEKIGLFCLLAYLYTHAGFQNFYQTTKSKTNFQI